MSYMKLKIEVVGNKNLGHCYSAAYYRVTSESKLTLTMLEEMFSIGMLGYGQEFGVNTLVRDGVLYPDVVDMIDDGVNRQFYVYHTYANCDSSD